MQNFKVVQHQGIDPNSESSKIVAQHASAYALAEREVEGKDVLEIGHGDGYGSNRLAQLAKSVLAIDLFDENSKKAALKYPKSNLTFQAMDACKLASRDEGLDLVCSFQVIEHIPQHNLPLYIAEIKRVLKQGGRAYISTLNLKNNLKSGVVYNKSPHHDKEFTPMEYREFFSKYFEDCKILGLYPKMKLQINERIKKIGLLNWLPKPLNPIVRYYENINEDDFEWLEKDNLDTAIDLMAVATK